MHAHTPGSTITSWIDTGIRRGQHTPARSIAVCRALHACACDDLRDVLGGGVDEARHLVCLHIVGGIEGEDACESLRDR